MALVLNIDWSKRLEGEDYTNLTSDAKFSEMRDDVDRISELVASYKTIESLDSDSSEEDIKDAISQFIQFQDIFEKYLGKDIQELIEQIEGQDKANDLQKTVGPLYKEFYDAFDSEGINIENSYIDDAILEASDSYVPMMNAAWPLECKPSDEEVKKLLDLAPQATIVSMVVDDYDEERYFVTMNGGGMDLSDHIAAAYAVIDGRIPKEIYNERHYVNGLDHIGNKEREEVITKCLEKMYGPKEINSIEDALSISAKMILQKEGKTAAQLIQELVEKNQNEVAATQNLN